MEFVILPLIWVMCSAGIGVIANKKGKSALWFFLLSMLLSPMLGIVMVLIVKSAKDVQLEEKEAELSEVEAVVTAVADTAILTPEAAESMRLKAAEQMQPAIKKETAAFQNADTNVFSPEEMEELRQVALRANE